MRAPASMRRLPGLAAALALAGSPAPSLAAPPDAIEAEPADDPTNAPPIPDPFADPHPEAAPEGPALPVGPDPAASMAPSSAQQTANQDTLKLFAPRKGTGLTVTGGTLLGLGIIGHGAGLGIIRGACLSGIPVEYTDVNDAEDAEVIAESSFGFLGGCGLGIVGGGLLSLFSGVVQFVGGPLMIGGLAMRGRHEAYQDVFARGGQRRKLAAHFATGGSLLGGGLILWFGGGAIGRASCNTVIVSDPSAYEEDPDAFIDEVIEPLQGFVGCRVAVYGATFNIGSAMVWTGSSLLAFGGHYRRHHKRYFAASSVTITPWLNPTRAGIGIRGRF